MTALVYTAISAVMGDLSHEGIGKNRQNTLQKYAFRGIDDVLNTLSGLLTKHKLIILPRVLSRVCEERKSNSGGALFYTAVHVEYDLISAEDGSKHTISVFGEAMDSSDKSTNKAMSAAYKYAAIQAFCIPTEGDNDADSTTHDVAPKAEQHKASAKPVSVTSGPQKPTLKEKLLSFKDPQALEDWWASEEVEAAFRDFTDEQRTAAMSAYARVKSTLMNEAA